MHVVNNSTALYLGLYELRAHHMQYHAHYHLTTTSLICVNSLFNKCPI